MNPKQPSGLHDFDAKPPNRAAVSKRHPLFGSLKGMIQVAPGVDLTEPADPEWADLLDEKYK
jgi:hypothetical protein